MKTNAKVMVHDKKKMFIRIKRKVTVITLQRNAKKQAECRRFT